MSWWDKTKDILTKPWQYLDTKLGPSGRSMRNHLTRVRARDTDDGGVELVVGHDIKGCQSRRTIGIRMNGQGATLVNKALDYGSGLTRKHVRGVRRLRDDLEFEQEAAEAHRNGERTPSHSRVKRTVTKVARKAVKAVKKAVKVRRPAHATP